MSWGRSDRVIETAIAFLDGVPVVGMSVFFQTYSIFAARRSMATSEDIYVKEEVPQPRHRHRDAQVHRPHRGRTQLRARGLHRAAVEYRGDRVLRDPRRHPDQRLDHLPPVRRVAEPPGHHGNSLPGQRSRPTAMRSAHVEVRIDCARIQHMPAPSAAAHRGRADRGGQGRHLWPGRRRGGHRAARGGRPPGGVQPR